MSRNGPGHGDEAAKLKEGYPSRQEIDSLKTKLSQWQSPDQMRAVVKSVKSRIGGVVLFNQAGLQFLMDAWVTAYFDEAVGVKEVCLVDDTWPDCRVQWADGGFKSFEIVEADDPDRRRGDEYLRALCQYQ